MKTPLTLASLALAAVVSAQTLDRVYNRDTGQPFKLKSITNDTKVLGPLVEQKTVFAFENPYTKLTEASVWFHLDWAAVLDGFAYWYKHEYVPGVLMDKQKAWFIYTAITSRNEDPGIMVQTSPSSYHAQIYPLAVGHDLRVELTSVGFLRPDQNGLQVPAPPPADGVPYAMRVTSYKPDTIDRRSDTEVRVALPKSDPLDLQMYAQRHRDGWVYVAGLVRRESPDDAITLKGLSNVRWTKPQAGDTSARWFIGRRKGAGTVTVQTPKATNAQRVKATTRGAETAKLWAHQTLIQKPFKNRKEVLNFSLKYGIPSTQTALLAVPQEQMKLFRKKEAEFQRKQAEQARRERAWQNQRQQNWRSTGGGDPEIRISLPGATRAYAVLPDGRRFELKATGDGFWGGSYDIPALAPEGTYTIKIVGVRADGSEFETSTSYDVDRTAPTGTADVRDGWLIVRSEAKLARVVAVMADGSEVELKESESEAGVYRLELGNAKPISIVMYDDAHNRGTIELR